MQYSYFKHFEKQINTVEDRQIVQSFLFGNDNSKIATKEKLLNEFNLYTIVRILKEALEIMDIESLELQKDTFINGELQENFSDLVYKVKINNKDAYICFLLEHKSYKDKMAIFQLNKYTFFKKGTSI